LKIISHSIASLCAVLMAVTPVLSIAQEPPLGPAPALQATNDIMQGEVDGKSDGRGTTSFITWYFCGFIPLYSLLVAALVVPGPGVERLVGKSAEYTYAYTRAFRSERRGTQLKYVALGTVTVLAIAVVALAILCSTSEPSCGDDTDCYPEGGCFSDDAESCNNDAETCNSCSEIDGGEPWSAPQGN
jgi:hypothetical protein